MKRINSTALNVAGFFAAAIMAATTMPATAVNLLAYYQVDSYSFSGGVPYTPNMAPGSTWGANASLDYSGGSLYQNTISSPGYLGDGRFEEQGTQARLAMTTANPFAATGSFTYALWMYTPSTFTGGAQTFMLSQFSANSAAGLDFKLMLRPTDLQLMTWGGSAVATVQTTPTMTSGNGWNHYAITASRSGSTVTWGVYENGTPITFNSGINSAGISTTFGSTISMNIGMASGGQSFGFNGVMADEIAFYDQVLTQSEIQQEMTLGPASIVPEPSAFAMLALGGGLLLLIRRRF